MFDKIDPVAVAMIGLAVIGAVEFIKRLFDRDYRTAAIIAVAVFVGALLAPQAGHGITWLMGALIGLNATGLVTLGKKVGGT